MTDTDRTVRGYRWLARLYDLLAVPRLTARQRREAVAQLALRPGDSALDLGCGTGLSLPALAEAVGPAGRVVGADLSPDQLARARQRVEAAGWQNVSLVQANAEELDLGERFQGILACYVHDIMTSPAAAKKAVDHLKPGGRFVALGLKRPAGWLAPLNALFQLYFFVLRVPINWHPEASRRPWANLERLLGPLEIRERFFGTWYRAVGVKPSS
ncbi:MAG: methyltransferase domain-containing protein [Chloroflexi bacterium]|nr:methyltransferase domain-containing protein [Chloroflexota bacterium]